MVESFNHLYIGSAKEDDARERQGAERDVDYQRRVAKSLMRLIASADASECASIEEVIGVLKKRDLLAMGVLDLLWTYVEPDKTPASATKEDVGAALSIIAMAAKVDRGLISSRLDLLCKPEVWAKASTDFHFGYHVCNIVEKIGQKIDLKDMASIQQPQRRFGQDFALLQQLEAAVLSNFGRIGEDRSWVPMMEKALNAVFHVAEHPEEMGQRWMLRCGAELQMAVDDPSRRSVLLVRWLSLVGHLAIRILVHIDVAYTGEVKRRHLLLEQERRRMTLLTRPGSALNRSPRPSLLNESSNSCNMSREDPDEDILGNQGAVEDVQAELIQSMLEDQVLRPEAPLAKASLVVLNFLQKDNWHRTSPPVFAAAATAFSKLLLISSKWTEPRLRLFFTILSSENVPAAVRDVLVIASGDLSVRFPNLVGFM